MAALKVSKSSRLGRYYNFISYLLAHDEIHRWEGLNLCLLAADLFWGTVLLLNYAVVAATCICGMVYSVCRLINAGLFSLNNPVFDILLIISGIFGWLFFVYFSLVFAVKRIEDRQERRNGNPSLFYAWIKAKKEKTCRIVDVVD